LIYRLNKIFRLHALKICISDANFDSASCNRMRTKSPSLISLKEAILLVSDVTDGHRKFTKSWLKVDQG